MQKQCQQLFSHEVFQEQQLTEANTQQKLKKKTNDNN